MAPPTWKDATSYSAGQRGKTVPRAWRLDTESLTLVLVRQRTGPGTYSPEWCGNVRVGDGYLLTMRYMGEDLEKAKEQLATAAALRLGELRAELAPLVGEP